VVVPVFDGAAFLPDCLASVREQTHPPAEVLVVDDGSGDGSRELATELLADLPGGRLLTHPGGANLGVSRTRALGVAEATGDLVAFLDADDAWEPGKLAKQVEALEAQPECVLCHTGAAFVGELDGVDVAAMEEAQAGLAPAGAPYGLLERERPLRNNPVVNSSVLARRAALEGLRFGTPQLFQYEDFLLWLLLAERGSFLHLPERLTRYRVHADSATARCLAEPLRFHYSRIELCLCLLALATDERSLAAAKAELGATLAEAGGVYAGEGGATAVAVDGLEDQVWRERAAQLERELAAVRGSRTWRLKERVDAVLRGLNLR
jgi:glycosyltransferase involved in cell wall biosynthesis